MLFRWEKDDCYSGGRRMMIFWWEKDDDVIPVGDG